jgi:dihydropteroate synthase
MAPFLPSRFGAGRRPAVFGIVNVTPDSFSDGGQHPDPESAAAHAARLAEEGADAIDVGGESTRPGSQPVPEAIEAARVVPTIAALRRAGVAIPVSVDTRKAAVADAALRAGATIVNDVSAGTDDPEIVKVAARHGAGMVLMHKRGDPATMQKEARYEDVLREVSDYLVERAEAVAAAGVPRERIWVDPGLGFGKTAEHNETILRGLESLIARGWPVLVGASRKSFLGAATGRPPPQRLAASLACAARAFEAKAAAVRVHDVAATVDLLRMLERIAPVAARLRESGVEDPEERR